MEQRILKSLLEPSAYPEPTTSVQLVQTHVSYLFLTDNFVYKVKKPVDFGFLNFTSADRRRFYCEEEVRLNRRLCPDLYLGVVEVRQSSTGATFGGKGTATDYAVKMLRLPHDRMLDHLLAHDQVTENDVKNIARTIAAFHLRAERSEEIDRYGRPDNIRRNWQENFEQVEEFTPYTVSNADLTIIRDWVGTFMTEHEFVFNNRVAEGHIRDCDGDLHTANICLTDQVCIFDCIEFNHRFRYSDTAADIAFLLMDLDFRGLSTFSELFLFEYIFLTGDTGVVQVLDFYKIYRAVVRGKVESFSLRDSGIAPEEKAAARERAIRYFRLARGYVIRQKLPLTLIVTCGLMGSGKSTIAARLSVELGIKRVSSDVVRKGKFAAGPDSRFSAYGTGIYTKQHNDEIYRTLGTLADEALSAGQSVIVDASFRTAAERRAFSSLAAARGAGFLLLVTTAPEEVVKVRLDRRLTDRHEVSDGRWELFQRQKDDFEPFPADDRCHMYLDTSLPLHDTIDRIIHRLGLP